MEITTIGLDIAKRVFQAHGVDGAGKAVLRRKLQRAEVLAFFEKLPPCLVGIEACGTAHHWAREIGALGHDVRLMPASYVKPYVKRGKTDAADAEATCEAVTRPTMRFVPVKTAEQQAVHKQRNLDIMAKPTLAKRSATDVVSLKVTLRGVKPPVWRRLLMPGTMTLGDLHQAIQAAMGWRDCHLHAFDIDGRTYGDRRTTDDVADENRLTLNGLLKSGIARFGYTYDFGDAWEHAVAIEKTQPAVSGSSYPACVAGKRNCPPEDCGGPWGYQHLMAVLADPEHPEHAEQLEWVGEEFDPDTFVIETANTMLAAQFKRMPPSINRPSLD